MVFETSPHKDVYRNSRNREKKTVEELRGEIESALTRTKGYDVVNNISLRLSQSKNLVVVFHSDRYRSTLDKCNEFEHRVWENPGEMFTMPVYVIKNGVVELHYGKIEQHHNRVYIETSIPQLAEDECNTRTTILIKDVPKPKVTNPHTAAGRAALDAHRRNGKYVITGIYLEICKETPVVKSDTHA